MKGYHNRPEDTKVALTPDGGFRTGDRGRLDKDGYLFITGRIKEQYKLENGKFCFPVSLEENICLASFVQQAVVYGLNRPYNICIIVPDFDVLLHYAKEKGLPTDIKMLVERQDIIDMISEAVTKQLKGKFGGYEIPKKFLILPEPFSLDNGTLTQTMKLKRKVVLDRLNDRSKRFTKNNLPFFLPSRDLRGKKVNSEKERGRDGLYLNLFFSHFTFHVFPCPYSFTIQHSAAATGGAASAGEVLFDPGCLADIDHQTVIVREFFPILISRRALRKIR